MTAMLLIGMVLAGAAAGLALRAFAMTRAISAQNLARIGAYGRSLDQPELPEGHRAGPLERALERSTLGSVTAMRRLLLGAPEEDVRALLRGAGLYRTSPTAYAVMRLLVLVGALLVALWLLATSIATPLALLLAILLVASAWFLPKAELRRRRDVRLRRVDRGLAELVDFLVVTIETGIGLSSALAAAARRFRAPLGDELRLTMQEQAMGLSLEDALRNFLARCETPMTRSFVRSIIQADTLGVSMGQILRGLAVEMRKRRRQAAEEQAHKAPVKIVFPLALLILPAMFLILLGPAVHDLIHGLGT